MNDKWTRKFPDKPGLYWFYGYRYGKFSCGHKCEPEFMLVKVFKISNGLAHTADGQFMYESEIEDAWFQPTSYPIPPQKER